MKIIYSLQTKCPRLFLLLIACFIALFSNAQGYIATSTYLGGNNSEIPVAIQVTGNEVHILGKSYSANYPVTNGSTTNYANGDYALVYTKLNASTGAIITSTYLGNNIEDFDILPFFMQVIGNEVHILRNIHYSNYPVTNGSTYGGGDGEAYEGGVGDILYTKLNSSTGAIITSTYLGGSDGDAPFAMQVIGNEVHILGKTFSGNYPVTNGSTYGGSEDFVYTKLHTGTGAIITSTYLGGNNIDYPSAMQVIGNDVHILGRSSSTNYPVTNGSTPGGSENIVYTKLNAGTGAIITSTYLGGSGIDQNDVIQVIGNEV